MEKKLLSDKKRLALMVLLTASVVGGSLLAIKIGLGEGDTSELILPAVVGVMVLLFMIPFIKRRYFDVKAGFPFEDERSKKVLNRAFAQAYVLSIWWLLILGWASDGIIDFRDVSQAMGMGILGMAVLFGLCFLYYNRRGDIE